MTSKINGTFILEGLIEGKIPQPELQTPLIREWAALVEKEHLLFHIEISGNQFSLLADNTPVQIKRFGSSPEILLTELLGGLLKIFPPDSQGRIFSTLRSIEYRKNLEVQTIYTIRPDGKVDLISREKTIETVDAEPAFSLKKILIMSFIAILGVAIFISASFFFIDYRSLFVSMKENVIPLNTKNVRLDSGYFQNTVILSAIIQKQDILWITVKKGEKFESSPEILNELYQKASSLQEKLVIESLAKGYVRLELADRQGLVYYQTAVRIADLGNKSEILFALDPPPGKKPAAISLGLY